MSHYLGCLRPDVHEVRGLTFTLHTCRSCHAETRVPR